MTREETSKKMDEVAVNVLGAEGATRRGGLFMRLLKRRWCKRFHVKRRLWVYATGVQPFWHCDKCNMRTP